MGRDKLIQVRRGTSAQWTSVDPTLASGEPGFETDTYKIKIGDGSTAWNSLVYLKRKGKGSDIASASALTIPIDGLYFDVTGTTTITSINTTGHVGTVIKLHFDGILTLTHHATDLILPTGANITTAVGDEAEFIEYAAGDFRCTNYSRADGTPLAGGSGGTLEYQTPVIAAAENLDATKKGLNKVYRVDDVADIPLTVTTGTWAENDVAIFERQGDGEVEFIADAGVQIRGVRDGENRYFIKDPFSLISLLCRGVVGSLLEFTIAGNLKRGYTGAVTTSLYSDIDPSDTADVAVIGTGFSSNMKDPIITGNGTLNSWVYNSPTSVTLNITTSGSEGDYLDVTWDNGNISTDTNAIHLTVASGVAVIMTTTSTSATWSPALVNNSGSTLRWTVTGDASGVYDANDPTIDLSGNIGVATIIVTSADDLVGWTTCRFNTLSLTSLDVTDWTACTELYVTGNTALQQIDGLSSITIPTTWTLSSNGLITWPTGTFSNVTTLKIEINKFVSLSLAQFPNLTTLTCNSQSTVTSLDLTANTSLTSLTASALANLSSVDISNNTALTAMSFASGGLTGLDISNNILLTSILVQTNHLTVSQINNIILDADASGVSTGARILNYASQSPTANPTATEYVTDDVLDAYNNLVSKGWTITGSVPS